VNSKKSKRLRSVAKQLADSNGGLPQKEWLVHNVTGQIINAPGSIRGFYRALKKANAIVNPRRTKAATS
jgi:hypothetical protein